ncbi:MAG: helix-turn-helix domain-containing protein [Ktedonobacteraceae bacterium]|nr:helix-turn-helix domain-containing protein [Ktedonobacteraceae bacterium]
MKQQVMIIAERLRTFREAARMTPTEVARKAQLKTEYILRVEQGRDPNLTVPAFLKWCQALEVDPAQIMACVHLEDAQRKRR